MTLESISKYELKGVNQCEFNENVGFNMDKAARFIEFQNPDIIYLEGIKSKESFDYFQALYLKIKQSLWNFWQTIWMIYATKWIFPILTP